jgi:hypothetical protein
VGPSRIRPSCEVLQFGWLVICDFVTLCEVNRRTGDSIEKPCAHHGHTGWLRTERGLSTRSPCRLHAGPFSPCGVPDCQTVRTCIVCTLNMHCIVLHILLHTVQNRSPHHASIQICKLGYMLCYIVDVRMSGHRVVCTKLFI